MDYSQGTELDHKDPFPEVYISSQLRELDGPLLKGCRELCLNMANKKALYQNSVEMDCGWTVEDIVQTSPQEKNGQPPVENFTWRHCLQCFYLCY